MRLTASCTGASRSTVPAGQAQDGARGGRVTHQRPRPPTFAATTSASSGTRCSRRPGAGPPALRAARWRARDAQPDRGRARGSARPTCRSRRAGITFAVNQGPEGVEKIMPFDLVPRIITAEEWRRSSAARAARPRAEPVPPRHLPRRRASCARASIPPELVLGSRGYAARCAAWTCPLGVYTHVVGSDLVRDETGDFTCWRTTCGRRPACPTSWRTGAC